MADFDQSQLFSTNGDSVRPGSTGYVMLPDDRGESVKVVEMHWGLRPAPGDRPWHNVRAEGRRVPVEQRCLVPADGYRITVKEGPNRGRWLVTWPGERDMCFAGIWRPALPDWPASYAIITCAPGPDLAPYEDRQSVFLEPAVWGAWLGGAAREEDVLKPLPSGSLSVTRLSRARAAPKRRIWAAAADAPLFKF